MKNKQKEVIYKEASLNNKELNLFYFTNSHSFSLEIIWKLNSKLI